MMSLFSPFDIFYENLIFISLLSFLYLFVNNIFKYNILTEFIYFTFNTLSNFFFSLKPKMFSKMSMLLMLSIMVSMMVLNFLSVFSFNFPLSSQLGPVLIISASIWGSFILFQSFWNMKYLFSHMIPEGSPIYLTFILFMIELVSNLIRPITLSVRLVANILAGHLLMILLSKMIFILPFMLPLYLLLNMVELFVALIQSYIFCTMISLYFSEVH